MTALRIGVPLALAALVSWADYRSGLAPLRLLAPLLGLIIFIYFFPRWPAPAYWTRVAVVTVLTVWLAVLPWVSWNQIKRLDRDCGRIQPGWSVEEAKAMMAPYVLHNISSGKPDPKSEFDWPHLTFWPDSASSDDWCVVFIRGEEVLRASAY